MIFNIFNSSNKEKNTRQFENFGDIAAESDQILLDTFHDHESYFDLRDHKKFLIIGRKGSGKSAIFRKILSDCSQRENSFAAGLNLDNYPWPYHSRMAEAGVPAENRFTPSWEYLILIQLCKIVATQDNASVDYGRLQDVSKLKNFLIDTYGSTEPSLDRIFSPRTRIDLRLLVGIGSRLMGGIQVDPVPAERLPMMFREVNRSILDAVSHCVSPDSNYYILFDELDRGFSLVDPEYFHLLNGLIQASRNINREIQSKGIKFSTGVFLREDIYEALDFEDKNKLNSSSVSKVDWTETGKLTLKSFMEKRFSLYFGKDMGWDDVFDRQSMGQSRSKYAHIAHMTLLRPRDIIAFCNEILRLKKASGDRILPFANKDVTAAEPGYSDYLYGEFNDEIRKHIPDFKDWLSILRNLEAITFKKDEFESSYKETNAKDSTRVSPKDFLERLYDFSIVGWKKGGGAYNFNYLNPGVRFQYTSELKIHPGLQAHLDLKKYRKKSR